MISDQNRLTEGMGSFLGGANSAVDAALLTDTQYSWARNVIIRDGYPATRPGFRFVKLLPSGVIQGACYFRNRLVNQEQIVSLIDGKLYNIFPTNSLDQVQNISPPNEPANPYISQRACLVQANNFLVLQDGTTPAIVYDGIRSYRSENQTEPVTPVNTITINLTAGDNTYNIATEEVTNILKVGMVVVSSFVGAIPDGTVITAIGTASGNPSTQLITLSKAPVTTVTTDCKFYNAGIIEQDISIPIGSIMCYGNGRLWVANGNELYAGDLVGSSTNAEVKFSETIYLSGGGVFMFERKITGLQFLPGPDSSTGLGDLIVFTEGDLNAIRASVYDRTQWQNTVGMQRKIFTGRGAAGFEAIITTDRDVYFRSLDGIRSVGQSVNTNFQTISFADSLEATRVTSYDTERWLKFAPGVLSNSRYLLGGAPKIQRVTNSNGSFTGQYNIVFSKLISKDFNAGMLVDSPRPVYEGEWTGLQICKLVDDIFDGERRCYAFTCDSDGKNCLYEITLADQIDKIKPSRDGDVEDRSIDCFVETKRFSFGNPFEVKELMRADVGFTNAYNTLNWTLDYSPDFFSEFYDVQSVELETPQSTAVLTAVAPPNLSFGYQTVRTVKPESVCVLGTKRLSNFAYMFQGRVSWTGQAKLVLFRLHASKKDNSDLGECLNYV
jgi:hypothetical protein